MDKRHHRHLISLSIFTILPYFAHTIIIRYEVCNFLTAGVLIFKGEEKCLMYYKIDFTTICFPFLNFEICLSDHHRNTFKKNSVELKIYRVIQNVLDKNLAKDLKI